MNDGSVRSVSQTVVQECWRGRILPAAAFDPRLLFSQTWQQYFNLGPIQAHQGSPTPFLLAHFHPQACKAQARMEKKKRKWGHVLFLPGSLAWLSLGPGLVFFYPWSCSLVNFIMIVLRRFLLYCKIPLPWFGSSPNRSAQRITTGELECQRRGRI